MKKYVSNITFREWTAAFMLLSGVGLSIAGFFVEPVGEISDSVLWFFAQCCIYSGSMLGVSVYINRQFCKIKSKLNINENTSGDTQQ